MKALIQTVGLVTALWGMSIPWEGLGVLSPLLAAPVKTPAKNAALQKLFRRGMDAYETKSYNDAADAFTQLLQKQPEYFPAKIQLARTYYQLKRLTDAYRLFLQIEDISLLDPDSSYEYGQCAFRNDEFANALKAYRNIPNGHPLFDLAGYYGGIAAFKQGEYQLALDLFAQAVVLPSKLLKSQKLYQKEAERLLIQQQKQELQNTTPPPVNRPGAAATVATVAPAEPPKPFRYLDAPRMIRLAPRVTLQSHQTNKHEDDHEIKGGTLALKFAMEGNEMAPKAAHWVAQLDASALKLESGSAEVLLLPNASVEQERLLLQMNAARSLVGVGAEVGFEWALTTGTSLGLKFGARGLHSGNSERPAAVNGAEEAEKLTESSNAAIPRFTIFLAQKNSNLATVLKNDLYGYTIDGNFLFSNARQHGRVEYIADNFVRFGLQGELSEYAYNVDRVNGPDWQGRILSDIGYGLDQGFRVSLGAFFEVTESQRLHDLGEIPVIEFNSNAYGARLRTDLPLGKYISLGFEAWIMERSSTVRISPNSEMAVPQDIFPRVISNFTLDLNVRVGS